MTTLSISLKEKVFDTIKAEAMRPVELVKALEGDAYGKEIEIAVSDLLEDGSIRFEYDGRLHPAVHAPAV